MMKMNFDVTAKKLFGVRYERLARTLFLRLRLLCPARAPQEEGQSPPPRLCLALPVPLLDGPQELSGQHGSDVGVARVLPVLLGQMEARFVLPIDFAVLFLNTPPCILLSCDPALEQAERFLPGQQRAFCVPCCLFIFGCDLAADIIFLCSWQIQVGGIVPLHALTAAAFALLSVSGSVLLE